MAEDTGELVLERVAAGRIEARYSGSDTPTFELRLGAECLASGAPVAHGQDEARLVSLPIPAEAINDGTTVLTLHRQGEAPALLSVLLVAGQPDPDDLSGQVAALRAEMDQVKALLRRRLS